MDLEAHGHHGLRLQINLVGNEAALRGESAGGDAYSWRSRHRRLSVVPTVDTKCLIVLI